MATSIDEDYIPDSVEYQVLRKHFSKLNNVTGEDVSLIAIDSFSEELISEKTMSDAMNDKSSIHIRSYHLTKGMLNAVAIAPDNLQEFISILEKHPPLDSIAVQMKNDLESPQIKDPTNSTCDQLPTVYKKSKEIIIDREVVDCYNVMRDKLGELVFEVQAVAESRNIDIGKLKHFICLKKSRNEDAVRKIKSSTCTTLFDVFEIICSDLCSPINVQILLDIADRFEFSDKVCKAIRKYEREQEFFRLKISSAEFAQKLQKVVELTGRDPTDKENVIILRLKSVQQSELSLTVAEFQMMLGEIFKELVHYTHILKVEGGSIVVTLFAPKTIMKALIVMAKRKTSYICDLGIVSITIGGETIIGNPVKPTKPAVSGSMSDISTEESGIDTQTTSSTSEDYLSSHGLSAEASGVPQIQKSNLWRIFPLEKKDVLVIGSFYPTSSSQVLVCPKSIPKNVKKSPQQWKSHEIDLILELYNNASFYDVRKIIRDNISKTDCLKYITILLQNCRNSGATIWYTGHGEKYSGNWCFKDGAITFDEIFKLYMAFFHGRLLTIISDCSYSGKWIESCVNKLDELGIPSCGHHTRQHGVLLQVFTSCEANEKATALTYINEGVFKSKRSVLHHSKTKLSSGQTCQAASFTTIYCSKPVKEPCEVYKECKWEDRIFYKYDRIRRCNLEKNGQYEWLILLVDNKDKLKALDKKRTPGSTFDVNDYGKVLYHGQGIKPPQKIIRKLDIKYMEYVDPA